MNTREHNDHPSGGYLVGAKNQILLEAANVGTMPKTIIDHAETELIRLCPAEYRVLSYLI